MPPGKDKDTAKSWGPNFPWWCDVLLVRTSRRKALHHQLELLNQFRPFFRVSLGTQLTAQITEILSLLFRQPAACFIAPDHAPISELFPTYQKAIIFVLQRILYNVRTTVCLYTHTGHFNTYDIRNS